MKKLGLICLSLGFILSLFILTLPAAVQGQLQTTSGNSTVSSGDGTNVVSVSASVAVQVRNETLKTKESMLKGAVVNFLNSGPNVLKIPSGDQPIIKTKIINGINKVTQSVEGIEATNAIIGIEIGKALKTAVSSPNSQSQPSILTVLTTSSCKVSSPNSTSCDNTVTIK